MNQYLAVIKPRAQSVLQATEHKCPNTAVFVVLVRQYPGRGGAPFEVFGALSLFYLLQSCVLCWPNAFVQEETTPGGKKRLFLLVSEARLQPKSAAL